ncbi:MAG: ParA family protein [Planctomycetota bacterium]
MRTIAFMNQKGGVGKTTCVVNLGSILAREFGKKVLLIDLDPQGNMSDHLGLDPFETEKSVYDIIINATAPQEIIQEKFGMDIIPANIDLAGAEVELACMTIRETRLRNALRGLCRGYDVTIIDCPPSLGLLTLSGLCLATEVIVPMQAEYLAMRGLGQLVHTVDLVQQNLNPKLSISGIVFCQYNSQTKLANEVLGEVTEHFPEQVYEAKIRKNIKLAESPSYSQPTVEYEPTCVGVEDYREFAAEFLRRGGEDVKLPEKSKPKPEDTEPPGNVTFVE